MNLKAVKVLDLLGEFLNQKENLLNNVMSIF